MKVYVIEVGEYSDRYVSHVTDNYEIAKQYVDYVCPDASITEFDTDDVKVDLRDMKKMYRGKIGFFCRMKFDGKIDITRESFEEPWNEPFEWYENNKIHFNHAGEYSISLLAEDEDHAKKIFADKIAQYKYENMEHVQKVEDEIKREREEMERKGIKLMSFDLRKPRYLPTSNAKLKLDNLVNDSIKFNEENKNEI